MDRRAGLHAGVAGAGAVLLSLGLLVACEDSTSLGGEAAFDAGTFDAAGGNPGIEGGDPNRSDAGEAGAVFIEPSIALLNLWGAPLDFCFKPPGAADFVGPVFAAEGGVPHLAASVMRPMPIGSEVILFLAGPDCTATPLFGADAPTHRLTPITTMVVRKEADDARKLFHRPELHAPGKDVVYFAPHGRDGWFTPGGGGAPIEIERGQPTLLDANVTGEVRLSYPDHPTFTRPMKTASGAVLVVETTTGVMICDELAPPNGHLLRCGDDVRAP